jgi:nitrile hydratase accessory protein
VRPDLDALRLPREGGEPVFRAPWEAQAFGMAVALNERGLFAWSEFAERLAARIAIRAASGQVDDGTQYYADWLAALEDLVAERGVVGKDELALRKEEWAQAARETPHGQPILRRRE